MQVIAPDRYGGLEDPSSGHRALPDKSGTIEWPDQLSDYAEKAHASGRFRIKGRQFAGFGEGKLPKPYRTESGEQQPG